MTDKSTGVEISTTAQQPDAEPTTLDDDLSDAREVARKAFEDTEPEPHEPNRLERFAHAITNIHIGRREPQMNKPEIPAGPTVKTPTRETARLDFVPQGMTSQDDIRRVLARTGAAAPVSDEERVVQQRLGTAIDRGSASGTIRTAAYRRGENPDSAEVLVKVAVRPAADVDEAMEQITETVHEEDQTLPTAPQPKI